MSASAVSIPHETGPMSESEAIDRLVAKDRAGKIPEPRTMDEIADDLEPGTDVPVDSDEPDENAQVEGDEFPDEDEQTAAPSGDPVVKFDDGTEMPLSEVKRGFLRQQDYTRKTQETAELRKTVESERGAYLAEKKQISERLTPLIQQAIAIIENPSTQAELNELRQLDPGAYAVKMMEMQQKQQTLQRLEFEQRQIHEAAAREEAERYHQERAKTAEESRRILIETIPAFKKDFNAAYHSLGEYVLSQGISSERWDNTVEHPDVIMCWKAQQYDNATRKTHATGDQLRKAPQPLRPGAAKPAGHAQARSIREATEKAHASGSIEDAIAAQTLRLRGSR